MNKALKAIVHKAAKENGITGIMALTEVSPISYERTRKVWDGVTTAKISDYVDVMSALGYEIKFNKRVCNG